MTTIAESSVPLKLSLGLQQNTVLDRYNSSVVLINHMHHILNSAKENYLKERANHTVCLKSDIKSINLRITRNSPAFDRYVFVPAAKTFGLT